MALRLPTGVEAVTGDETGEFLVVQTGPAAPRSLNRAVLDLVKERLDHPVVVQLVGSGEPAGDGVTDHGISPAPGAPLEIVAVHTEPGTGELELHLRGREPARWAGPPAAGSSAPPPRPSRRGMPVRMRLAGRRLGAHRRDIGDGRFVVAVALEDSQRVIVAHGIGSGPKPSRGRGGGDRRRADPLSAPRSAD